MERGASAADPLQRRLSMQKEIVKILNRVEELAERMQRRAEELTREMRDLECRAGAAERDLKGAFDAFRRLSDTHFVENIIAEEDQASCTKDRSRNTVDRNIPAQDYEVDILPRYKEAVLLGLKSYEDHMKKGNKRYSARSTFNPWSVRGPLPHIIGSEEYIHDNSCGLIDDSLFGSSFGCDNVAEMKESLPDTGPSDLFNSNIFGTGGGPFEKDENEPLVSAALDFKAMLEAALRSPYKFYDEATSSHAPESDDRADADQVTQVPDIAGTGNSGLICRSDGASMPVLEGEYFSCIEGSEIHQHNISSLISGSLFDSEEPPSGAQEQPDTAHETAHGDASVPGGMVSNGSTCRSPSQGKIHPDIGRTARPGEAVTLSDSGEETVGLQPSLEGLAIIEDTSCDTSERENVVGKE